MSNLLKQAVESPSAHPTSVKQEIPLGFCQCGCGKPTDRAKRTRSKLGHKKGEFLRYPVGHSEGYVRPQLHEYMKNTPDPNPSGLCMCGCGKPVGIAPANDPRYGIVKGLHLHYRFGHQRIMPAELRRVDGIPLGKCGCGCDGDTKIANSTDRRDGTVKGQPRRYIIGHGRRTSPLLYVVEDRGYKTPCWIWQKAKGVYGYGQSWDVTQKRQRPAHCIEYEKVKGPIPEGLTLDHLCRVPPCINPDHLEPVTREVNSRRAMNSKLDESKVLRMRYLHGIGVRYAELARMYDISRETARKICLRYKWKSVK